MGKKRKIMTIGALVGMSASLVYSGISYYMMQQVTEPQVLDYGTVEQRLKTESHLEIATLPFTKTELKTDDQKTIETIVYHNPKPSGKVIVLSHGIKQNAYAMLTFFKMYDALGFDIVSFSYRNHGASTKGVTTFGKTETKDLASVVEYAHTIFGEQVQYGIHGVSMGAAIMLQYAGQTAEQPRYQFLVSDCSFSDLGKLLQTRLQEDYAAVSFLPLVPSASFISEMTGRFDFYDISPRNDVKKIEKPILFVHGTADAYIPIEHVHELYEAKKGKKALLEVEKAAHATSYITNSEAYDKAIDAFLQTI